MRFWHSGKDNTCATAIMCIQCNQGPSPRDQFWGFEYFFLNLCIQINNACPFQLINIQQVYLFLCSLFCLTAKINFYQPFFFFFFLICQSKLHHCHFLFAHSIQIQPLKWPNCASLNLQGLQLQKPNTVEYAQVKLCLRSNLSLISWPKLLSENGCRHLGKGMNQVAQLVALRTLNPTYRGPMPIFYNLFTIMEYFNTGAKERKTLTQFVLCWTPVLLAIRGLWLKQPVAQAHCGWLIVGT